MISKSLTHYRVLTLWVPVALIAALISCYFLFLYRHAVNVPFQDDISDTISFMTALLRSGDGLTSAKPFLVRWGSHVTSTARLTYYIAYLVQGEINFRTLTIVASLAYPAFLGFLFLRLRDNTIRWLLLLPAAMIIFQLRSYGIVLWVQSAFPFFYALIFGFAALFLLHRVNRWRFSLSIIFATLSTYSLAAGPLAWPLGLVSLWHQSVVTKTASKAYLLCWGLVAIGIYSLWTIDFGSLTQPPIPFTFQPVDASVLPMLIGYIRFFLILLGSAVTDHSQVMAMCLGALLFLTLFLITLKRWQHADIRLELCAWYIVLFVAAVTIGRANMVPLEYALTSRYSIFSVLLLAVCWTLFAVNLRSQQMPIILLAILGSGLYTVNSYAVYSDEARSFLNQRIRSYNAYRYPVMGYAYQQAKQPLVEAVTLGIYKRPKRPLALYPVHGLPDEKPLVPKQLTE